MEAKQTINVTCPDCRGPITEVRIDDMVEYRCLVGHAYSPRSMLQSHSETQERALWAAVVALEEAANLARIVAPQFNPAAAQKLEQQADCKMEQAGQIRAILEQLEPFELE